MSQLSGTEGEPVVALERSSSGGTCTSPNYRAGTARSVRSRTTRAAPNHMPGRSRRNGGTAGTNAGDPPAPENVEYYSTVAVALTHVETIGDEGRITIEERDRDCNSRSQSYGIVRAVQKWKICSNI